MGQRARRQAKATHCAMKRVLRTATYRDDLHTVKAGINYHFNWGGPVVAKY